MTSMKCYKPAEETCHSTKSNHHGHQTGHHLDKTHTRCYSQTQTYSVQSGHNHGHHSRTSHSHGNNHGLGHGLSGNSHGKSTGHHTSSHGVTCHGKTDKVKKSKVLHKKEEDRCNKRKDANSSCSDSGSDSD